MLPSFFCGDALLHESRWGPWRIILGGKATQRVAARAPDDLMVGCACSLEPGCGLQLNYDCGAATLMVGGSCADGQRWRAILASCGCRFAWRALSRGAEAMLAGR